MLTSHMYQQLLAVYAGEMTLIPSASKRNTSRSLGNVCEYTQPETSRHRRNGENRGSPSSGIHQADVPRENAMPAKSEASMVPITAAPIVVAMVALSMTEHRKRERMNAQGGGDRARGCWPNRSVWIHRRHGLVERSGDG